MLVAGVLAWTASKLASLICLPVFEKNSVMSWAPMMLPSYTFLQNDPCSIFLAIYTREEQLESISNALGLASLPPSVLHAQCFYLPFLHHILQLLSLHPQSLHSKSLLSTPYAYLLFALAASKHREHLPPAHLIKKTEIWEQNKNKDTGHVRSSLGGAYIIICCITYYSFNWKVELYCKNIHLTKGKTVC